MLDRAEAMRDILARAKALFAERYGRPYTSAVDADLLLDIIEGMDK